MNIMNAAIIGCGEVHSVHAEAIKRNPAARLKAVVDTIEERAAKSAEKYSCEYFTDYREMLKRQDIDTVHICTPHYLHHTMAIDALKSGKNVLCEKPMAIKPEYAVEMIEVSKSTGKTLGICLQNRYSNTSKFIKEFLNSEKSGRILGARAIITWSRGCDYYRSAAWRGSWDKEGGGVLINQAIHTIDLLQWFMGDILRMKGSFDTRLLGDCIEVEDTAEATIIFKNGVNALLYFTNCHCANSPVFLEIIGEKASIRLEGDLYVNTQKSRWQNVASNKEGAALGKDYYGAGHGTLINDYYDTLAKGGKFAIDGCQGITSLKIVDAWYMSAKLGRFVEFS
jgi:UDP-N-acetyl-2-amino-2-deoxyglucuronate dehydrogenase